MSTQVSDSEQGELQGGLGSMSSLTSIVSPPFMTTLFAAFTGATAPLYVPGAPWLAAAILTLLSMSFSNWLTELKVRERWRRSMLLSSKIF